MTLKERIARAIWLRYCHNYPDADWNAVSPHYKETLWLPMAQAALETMVSDTDIATAQTADTIRHFIKAAIAER